MNDLEERLRALAFRPPAPEWRREILAQCPAPARSWSEWFWPSPLAWAALAMVWCMLGVSSLIEKPVPKVASARVTAPVFFAHSPSDELAFFFPSPSR